MKLQSILVAAVAAALVVPALAQEPAAAGGSADAQAAATFQALAPIVGPRTAELSAAGVQKVVARTGKKNRDIQVLTKWGPAYFPWPKDVTPVTFEIYVKVANEFDVIAAGYTEANKARYAAAFDAIFPHAVRLANDLRIRAQRPRK